MLVFPDNATAVDVFADMQTQWRAGMGGKYGLDYAAIPFVCDMHGIEREDMPDIYRSLRIMERAALAEIHKDRGG